MIFDQINKLRDEIMDLLKKLQGALDKKIGEEELWKSEASLLEKIDEIVGALMKKCADKNETKKALIFLEKKIN